MWPLAMRTRLSVVECCRDKSGGGQKAGGERVGLMTEVAVEGVGGEGEVGTLVFSPLWMCNLQRKEEGHQSHSNLGESWGRLRKWVGPVFLPHLRLHTNLFLRRQLDPLCTIY